MKIDILRNGFYNLNLNDIVETENNLWERKELKLDSNKDFNFNLVVAKNKETNELDYYISNFNMKYEIKDVYEEDLLEDIYTNRLKELFI